MRSSTAAPKKKTPTLNYVGALMLRDRNILLGRRSKYKKIYPGSWDVIGGSIEPNETPPAALVREVFEELGVEVVEMTLAGTVSGLIAGVDRPFNLRLYRVTEWVGEVRLVSDEHDRLAWIPVGDLSRLNGRFDPRLAGVLPMLVDCVTPLEFHFMTPRD